MGWSHCGTDSEGREIGYGIEATCDHPGCHAEITRGLSYACGGWHGETDFSCERYFCPDHLYFSTIEIDREVHPWGIEFCEQCVREHTDERGANMISPFWRESTGQDVFYLSHHPITVYVDGDKAGLLEENDGEYLLEDVSPDEAIECLQTVIDWIQSHRKDP